MTTTKKEKEIWIKNRFEMAQWLKIGHKRIICFWLLPLYVIANRRKWSLLFGHQWAANIRCPLNVRFFFIQFFHLSKHFVFVENCKREIKRMEWSKMFPMISEVIVSIVFLFLIVQSLNKMPVGWWWTLSYWFQIVVENRKWPLSFVLIL